MRALTLTQPWASLVALRHKTIETRSWRTDYKGYLVIHAAKGFPAWAKETCEEIPFSWALDGLKASDLPRGRGLCVVKLLGCVKTTEMHKAEFILGYQPHSRELHFGDYTEGRYAWLMQFVQPMDASAPEVKGSLGLWEWPDLYLPEVRS